MVALKQLTQEIKPANLCGDLTKDLACRLFAWGWEAQLFAYPTRLRNDQLNKSPSYFVAP